MKLKVLSCDAQRPDSRAIAKCFAEISTNMDESQSKELAIFLLEGDVIDIEVDNRNSASALRALRKLSIDYEIAE